MLSNLLNIFKISDLRNKVLFVVAMVVVYRLGVAIRVPGVDPIAIEQLRRRPTRPGALGFINLFSGGAFESFSIFALGIMPYITASIIMQVLGVVIPKLEELQQEGAVGQRKITQYTRYVTIGLATLQATGLVFIFGTGQGQAFFTAGPPTNVPLLTGGIWPRGYLIIPTLVAGTAVLMWLGELISQRGIGNGMSMIIFASVVASLPGGFLGILQLNKWFWFVAMVILTIGIIVAVVFVELGQRRIPVQFAKRVVGRRMMGGQNTYIPLKVNQSGVIPIIFASSILLLPVIFSNVLGGIRTAKAGVAIDPDLDQRLHRQPAEPRVRDDPRDHDHRVRLLLQLDRVRPGAPGRPAPQAGRLHPRYPARSLRPRSTWAKRSTASRCPVRCSSRSSRSCPYLLLIAATSTRSGSPAPAC